MTNKKIATILLSIIAAFAVLSSSGWSYFYSITPHCAEDICIEGQEGIWEINITNDGFHDVKFTAIELVDAKNNTPFAAEKRAYFPQSDNPGDLIEVRQKRKTHINITGVIPAANSGMSHAYYPCFILAIYDFYTIARDEKYEERQCFPQNETMGIVQCINSNHCSKDRFCKNNKCIILKCKECQHISEHACEDYKCCSNEQCSVEELCQNNTCIRIECENHQYLSNHSCNSLECSFDEQIVNRSCQKLDCGFEEFAFNHTCKKLDCSYDKFIINHTCKPLNCIEEEMIKDHLCIPLDCSEDERVYNHTCQKLDCWFFQDITDHQCANNRNAVTKLILEFIAVIVILAFLLLDFSKFESMHLKKKIPKESVIKELNSPENTEEIKPIENDGKKDE